MRKFLHLFFCLSIFSFVAISGSAREIPANEAARIAGSYGSVSSAAHRVQGNVQPVLVYTETDDAGHNLFYVFNRPGRGFIIVAADDNARTVLAYSDTQEISDFSIVPDNMRNLLRDYAQQISAMRLRSDAKAPVIKDRRPVGALTSSMWDQRAPYNIQCPMVTDDKGGNVTSVTGCVATAMAQVMKYYGYPQRGIGSATYSDNGTQRTANFNHSYDWTNMPDVIDDNSAAAAKDEIARLMYDCAAAVSMQFTQETSAAATSDVPKALIDHFGYDKAMLYEARSYYTDEEWEDKIYAELLSQRPVIYAANSSFGGHTFIIDGVDANGLFHVNWGWGGAENGYFAITGAEVLNPAGGGAGASSERLSYNQNQHALFGIQPDRGNAYNLSFVSEEPLTVNVTQLSRPLDAGDPNAWVEVGGVFTNVSLLPQEAEYAILFENTATKEQKLALQHVVVIEPINGVGLGHTNTIMVHQSELEWVADGTYSITPMWRVGGAKAEWKPFNVSPKARTAKPSITLTNGHVFYVTKKVEVIETAADGIVAKVTLHANKDYKGYIRPFIAESSISELSGKTWTVLQHDDGSFLFDSKSVRVDLKAGETKDVILGPFPYETIRYDFEALLRLRVSQNENVTRDDDTPDAPIADDIETIFTMTIARQNPQKIFNSGFLAVASPVANDLVFTVPVHANTDVKGKLAVRLYPATKFDNEGLPTDFSLTNGTEQNIPVINIDLKAGTDSLITIRGKYNADQYDIYVMARVFFIESGEFNFAKTDQVLEPFTDAAQSIFTLSAPITEFQLNPLTDLIATSNNCDNLMFSISLYSTHERDLYLIIPYIYEWYDNEENPDDSYFAAFMDSDERLLADSYVKKVHLKKGVNNFTLGPIVYRTEEYNMAGYAEIYFSFDGTWDLDDNYFYWNNYLGRALFEIGVPVGIEDVATSESERTMQNNQVYSISGQYMGTNPRNLPRGLYIIGGKKVLVK